MRVYGWELEEGQNSRATRAVGRMGGDVVECDGVYGGFSRRNWADLFIEMRWKPLRYM